MIGTNIRLFRISAKMIGSYDTDMLIIEADSFNEALVIAKKRFGNLYRNFCSKENNL